MATSSELARWNAQLASGDPYRVGEAAAGLAAARAAVDPEWVFTVYDELWRPVGELGADLIEASGTDPRNGIGSATITVKGDSTLVGHFMGCRERMVGLTVETAGLRYAYYVTKHSYSYADGAWTSTCELRSIADVMRYLVIIPLWFLPIQIQPISHAFYFGPICTVIENMIAECALVLQAGVFDLLNNALSLNPDIRTWFATLLQSDGNILAMLKRPIYVVRTNPLLDTSPFVLKTVRMETVAAVVADLTGPYGIDIAVDLWMPGDQQPDRWANLDRPTYVVRVRDRSQIEGPTKTILDSAIRSVVDLTGSLFGDAVSPLIRAANGLEAVFVAPALGVNFIEPWIILEAPEPGRDGAVVTAEIVDHAHTGWRHIVGGKSPQWLNRLINAWLSWLVDAATIILGFSGVPSDLLEGFLNDAFFAFQQWDHYERRAIGGPYHPATTRFHPTQSSPYNLSTFFNFVKVLWESRGYTSATVVVRNAQSITLGRDVFRSSLVSIVYQGRTRMLTDFVDNIMWRISATERDIMLQIGDGRAEEPPLAKHQRNLTALFEGINSITMAPRS